MSVTYVSAELRRLVIGRANRRCEYCLLHEDDTALGCEVDHLDADGIVPLTDVGEVTARIFGFNTVERRMERQALQEIDRYPG